MKRSFDSSHLFVFEPEPDFISWQGALRYLYHILYRNRDTIINCDEDCFITNVDELMLLIKYMKDNGYDYCGMSDGGTHHRNNDPVIQNPFFNIFLPHVGVDIPFQNLKDFQRKPPKEQTLLQLSRLNKFNHEEQMTEPFNPLFSYLEYHYTPLYLEPVCHPDGISTILLSHRGIPFCVHSWYSREYGSNEFHTKRIDALTP